MGSLGSIYSWGAHCAGVRGLQKNDLWEQQNWPNWQWSWRILGVKSLACPLEIRIYITDTHNVVKALSLPSHGKDLEILVLRVSVLICKLILSLCQ